MNEYYYIIPVELQDRVLGEIELTVSADSRLDADKKVQELCKDQIRGNFNSELVHCEQTNLEEEVVRSDWRSML